MVDSFESLTAVEMTFEFAAIDVFEGRDEIDNIGVGRLRVARIHVYFHAVAGRKDNRPAHVVVAAERVERIGQHRSVERDLFPNIHLSRFIAEPQHANLHRQASLLSSALHTPARGRRSS